MEKEKMLQIAVPAIAVAAVILVVALIINGASAPAEVTKAGSGIPPAIAQGKKLIAEVPVSPDGVGLQSMPDLNAPEWRPSGEGVKIWDVKVGEGETGILQSDDGLWHYTGWLPNGHVFDSSLRKGEPFSTNLYGVVKGWTQGLTGMKVGGIRRLYIPSALGYGSQGAGRDIPPNTDLVFEVKLLRISR